METHSFYQNTRAAALENAEKLKKAVLKVVEAHDRTKKKLKLLEAEFKKLKECKCHENREILIRQQSELDNFLIRC